MRLDHRHDARSRRLQVGSKSAVEVPLQVGSQRHAAPASHRVADAIGRPLGVDVAPSEREPGSSAGVATGVLADAEQVHGVVGA